MEVGNSSEGGSIAKIDCPLDHTLTFYLVAFFATPTGDGLASFASSLVALQQLFDTFPVSPSNKSFSILTPKSSHTPVSGSGFPVPVFSHTLLNF